MAFAKINCRWKYRNVCMDGSIRRCFRGNGLILDDARVYYTMANDGLFFKKAGKLNSNAVPAYALVLQCVFASAWSLSGKYGDLLDMISFVVVCFYMLTIAGIFILRKKR